MECISVFDIFKLGVGPSSSHTLGPWRAAMQSRQRVLARVPAHQVQALTIHLFGSLAKTGKGHGTGLAVMMGSTGMAPTEIWGERLLAAAQRIRSEKRLALTPEVFLEFDPARQILYHTDQRLPFHPNGMTFAWTYAGGQLEETYYSVGGGFITQENEAPLSEGAVELPFPIASAADWKRHSGQNGRAPWEVVAANEYVWRTPEEVEAQLLRIWDTMQAIIYRGCHASGVLPGGLAVSRRAGQISRQLLKMHPAQPMPQAQWVAAIADQRNDFQRVLKWISCFALAVNEENAAFGQVVTAPTNGAAGVIPAVLMYMHCFAQATIPNPVLPFMLVAGEIGSLFKKGATISAAMGGCQAEIGVSSAMAAGGLTASLGGDIDQILMAAEIAMEHHLGMTCDPIGGLVQIPCIERNCMGAIKAITAAQLAMEGDPMSAKISLDAVIRTMWETAQDMNEKYKETAEGGLALHIPVNVVEC